MSLDAPLPSVNKTSVHFCWLLYNNKVRFMFGVTSSLPRNTVLNRVCTEVCTTKWSMSPQRPSWLILISAAFGIFWKLSRLYDFYFKSSLSKWSSSHFATFELFADKLQNKFVKFWLADYWCYFKTTYIVIKKKIAKLFWWLVLLIFWYLPHPRSRLSPPLHSPKRCELSTSSLFPQAFCSRSGFFLRRI